jgi:hypothetical protein
MMEVIDYYHQNYVFLGVLSPGHQALGILFWYKTDLSQKNQCMGRFLLYFAEVNKTFSFKICLQN